MAIGAIDIAEDLGHGGDGVDGDLGFEFDRGQQFDQIRVFADRNALGKGNLQNLFGNAAATGGHHARSMAGGALDARPRLAVEGHGDRHPFLWLLPSGAAGADLVLVAGTHFLLLQGRFRPAGWHYVPYTM
jgi:hypothetical protein